MVPRGATRDGALAISSYLAAATSEHGREQLDPSRVQQRKQHNPEQSADLGKNLVEDLVVAKQLPGEDQLLLLDRRVRGVCTLDVKLQRRHRDVGMHLHLEPLISRRRVL
jgi:hypothetical protein